MDSRSLSITQSRNSSRSAVVGLYGNTSPMFQELFCFVERTRNNMNGDEFPNTTSSNGTGFGRGFHGTDIATYQHRHVAIEKVFFSNQNDIGRLHHGFSRF